MSITTLIKSIQDIMRKDVGVDGDAQRISQMVWLLFLKIFDDKEKEWELVLDSYKSPLPDSFRWRNWASNAEGMTGEELIDWVNNNLFPQLKKLATIAGEDERARVVGSVFEDGYNYMKSGTLLRQVINKIEEDIDFNSTKDRHLFGDIYEKILKDLQSAGNAGEYYTPRAVTQFMVDMVNPQLGEKVLDPACGTGGFLTCTIENLRKQVKNPDQEALLQKSVFGIEKKPLPHMLASTNMLLHDIEIPSNIRHDNTLSKPLRNIGPKDRIHCIITNPPFGGMEEDGIESNFPKNFQTRETADLFLVYIIHMLRPGGRAAIVLPDGSLFGEGVKTRIKEKLLTDCNLHTIIRLPNGVFSPYTGIKTNLLFFTKGEPTKEIWYYEHQYPKGAKSYNKTNPINIREFDVEKEWWDEDSISGRAKREESEFAWKVSIEDIKKNNFNLDIKNPNVNGEDFGDPDELLAKYKVIAGEVKDIRDKLKTELMKSLGGFTEVDFLHKNFSLLVEAPNGIKKLREMILQFAVQGKLTEDWRSENPDVEPTFVLLEKIKVEKERLIEEGKIKKQKPLEPIQEDEISFFLPNGWEWVRLDEITKYIQRGKGPQYVDVSDMPVISQKCIQWPGFEISKARFIEPSSLDKYGEERFLRTGDLLWNSTGTGTIGRINVYVHEDNIYEKVVVDSHVTVVRPLIINPSFLYNFLRSPIIQEGFEDRASGSTNQIELNTSTVKTQIIPIPPLNEQKIIVSRVDSLMILSDKLEKKFIKKNTKSEKIFSALVNRLNM